jgi:predicted dehydrogenase
VRNTTFALIGSGIVGERIINQLRNNESATIVALFDENDKCLNEMENTYGLYAASSIKEVLELKPDWIYIGTPYVALCTEAFANSLNVLCEKPLAHDAADGLVMASAAADSTIQTAMYFPVMYSPSARHMMKLINEGEIGQIVRIELQTYFPHWPRLWQQKPWIALREKGGFTREVFPHYLQLMYRMFG